MKNILEVTEKPLVSIDFKGSFCSSTVDASLTMVMGDDMVKIVAWCAAASAALLAVLSQHVLPREALKCVRGCQGPATLYSGSEHGCVVA